jgi:hypothetical protein
MPRGEPPFFHSNPPEKPGHQTHSHSIVPGNVSASPAVAIPSVQAVVAPKSPTQSKSSTSKKKKTKGDNVASPAVAVPSVQAAVVPKPPTQSKSSTSKKKKTKGDNVVTLSFPASATTAPKPPTQSKTSEKNKASATTSTSTALLPSAPKSLSMEKKREQIQCLAKVLKAASPHHPPVVVAPKEAAPALAPSVSNALGTLLESNASLSSGSSSLGSSPDDDSSSGSSSDDNSSSSSSQPAMVTGGSIVGSGTAIVFAAELIAAVSAATSMTALSSTNPLIEAVTEEVLDAVSAPAHEVPMEPYFAVFVQV